MSVPRDVFSFLCVRCFGAVEEKKQQRGQQLVGKNLDVQQCWWWPSTGVLSSILFVASRQFSSTAQNGTTPVKKKRHTNKPFFVHFFCSKVWIKVLFSKWWWTPKRQTDTKNHVLQKGCSQTSLFFTKHRQIKRLCETWKTNIPLQDNAIKI